MINEILSIFDEALHEKCWIDVYGRLAITGRQKIGEKQMRFPVSADVITTDQCMLPGDYFSVLVPDDQKKGVAFWKTLQPITYVKLQGVSAARRIKKAEATVQFVCWLNIQKASGVTESTNWGTALNKIVKEAVKTLDCPQEIRDTGITGISNLRVDVISIGDIDTWRKAMSEYSIDRLEAVSVWPFAAFTITCKLQFLVRGECFDEFDCFTPECGVTITNENLTICSGGSITLVSELTGSGPASYQWQALVDDEWTDIEDATSESYATGQLIGDVDTVFSFRVKAFICNCSAISSQIDVIMQADPQVYAYADATEIPDHSSTILHSEVIGGAGGNSYQWQEFVNGQWFDITAGIISGPGNLADYVTPLLSTGVHTYRVVVTQDAGCEGISDPLVITVLSGGGGGGEI